MNAVISLLPFIDCIIALMKKIENIPAGYSHRVASGSLRFQYHSLVRSAAIVIESALIMGCLEYRSS